MSTNQSLAYPTIIPMYANPAYKGRTSRARDITFSVMFVYLHDLADGAILLRKLAIHASNAASLVVHSSLCFGMFICKVLKRSNDVKWKLSIADTVQSSQSCTTDVLHFSQPINRPTWK